MIKYVILFIHLIGLSIYQLFFGDVTATQKIPDKVSVGEEITIEVTIFKDDVTGFAKVQQTLPVGFTAEVVDAKGATFSFKENTVKFIWMALPADKEFTITYKLITTQDILGKFTIGGKFSFISDNERKNIDIAESSINIVKESDVVADVKEEPKTTDPVVEPVTQEPVVEVAAPEVIENTTNTVNIQTARTIEDLGGKYKITLKVNQTNLDGFAKFTDVIPNGFTAIADNAEGGIFSFKEGEAKILWMAAPKKDEFSVSYFIEPTASATDGNFDINGSLSYLENDVTQKHIINSSTFTHKSQIASVEETPTTKEVIEKPVVEPKKEVSSPIKKEEPKPVTNKTQPVKEEKSVPVVTSTPSAEKGVTYKVQVGAGHQNVSKNYFASKFSLSDAVSTESHEGWIKYLVGKFTEYKQARDKRNDVRNNIKNAFVTAYNQGKRITVQEALMISNQKWYQ
jgi:hypothetical protein